MATRTRGSTHALRRRIDAFQRRPGNWRFKGLVLALMDGADQRRLGHAWPTHRAARSDVVDLGARDDDTHEHQVARQLFGKDAVQDGEVIPTDQYIKRALVNEAATELDVLWRDIILDSIEAGAATRRIARDATTVTEVDAKRGTIPVHNQIPFAETGAEAANAPDPNQGYTAVDYTAEKHEAAFAVTDELLDQAEPDMLEAAVRYAGEAVENSINRQHLINVVDNAGQNQGSVGNEATVQTLLEAAENVADNDFDPVNIAILHPELLTEVADDPALGYLDFSRDRFDGERELQAAEQRTRPVQQVGPELYVASDATYNGLSDEAGVSGSNTWGWESGSEIGGVVYGRPFVHTVVYRDVQVSEFTEPVTAIHDLQGGVASAWTDSVQASNNAISKITQ